MSSLCKLYRLPKSTQSPFMGDKNYQLPREFREAFAGFVAGVASVWDCSQLRMLVLMCQTLVAHPLDVIKTRLQGKNSAQVLCIVPTLRSNNHGQSIESLLPNSGVRCDCSRELSAMRGPSVLSTGVLRLISSATPSVGPCTLCAMTDSNMALDHIEDSIKAD